MVGCEGCGSLSDRTSWLRPSPPAPPAPPGSSSDDEEHDDDDDEMAEDMADDDAGDGGGVGNTCPATQCPHPQARELSQPRGPWSSPAAS